jgi:Trm5-related predicted tRNA methylase
MLKTAHSKTMTPTGTEARVCADIAKRQQIGLAKYKTTVEANPLSLREWLQHAYEETLDKAVYLKRAIEEMEKTLDK